MSEIVLYSIFGKLVCQPFSVNTVDMCRIESRSDSDLMDSDSDLMDSDSDLADKGFVDHDFQCKKEKVDPFDKENDSD